MIKLLGNFAYSINLFWFVENIVMIWFTWAILSRYSLQSLIKKKKRASNPIFFMYSLE